MDKGTIIRVVVFALAWFNQYLTSKGIQPLPILDEVFVSTLITFVVSVWTLFKNNYITKKGIDQREVLKMNELTK